MVNSYHNNDNISFDDVKKNIYYTQDILNNNENNQEQKNVYEAITFIASQGYTCVEVK